MRESFKSGDSGKLQISLNSSSHKGPILVLIPCANAFYKNIIPVPHQIPGIQML